MSVVEVWPTGSMALLTQTEADSLSLTSQGELYDLYRLCSLAVLNIGSVSDNSSMLMDKFKEFEINLIRNERGLKIELVNPPERAVIDGIVIKRIRNHLYSVLRDIVYTYTLQRDLSMLRKDQYRDDRAFTTNLIFVILRNAGVLKAGAKPNLAVCWGGHSIPQHEYDYAYSVGLELGLRKIDICTGCGPGVMEAPMKGSFHGYTLQGEHEKCRLIGLTEPSIIAAEPPNAMVSELVILPDIEKRLEAFVRLGHTLIIYPGGPGTVEELLFILSIKMMRENKHNLLPLILTGGKESVEYFKALEDFLELSFGREVKRHYEIIIDDPKAVASKVKRCNESVEDHRTITHDSYCFNWSLIIPEELQKAVMVNHEYMESLKLTRDLEPWELACNLRAAFSGIVAGHIKDYAIKQIEEKGPFVLHGDKELLEAMDALLKSFISQGRIFLSKKDFKPCYRFEPS